MNQPTYSTSSVASNPFSGPGPSAESWQRDVNELGFDVQMGVKKKQQNDNIQEFKDLFATGMEKISQSSGPKRGIDLTYNPGTLPAAPKEQPAMAAPVQQPVMQPPPMQPMPAPTQQ